MQMLSISSTHSFRCLQHLLLVHTPTREFPSMPREWEAGHEDGEREVLTTSSSFGRNRALRGLGNDGTWSPSPRSRSNTLRDNTVPERLRTPQIYGSPAFGNISER